MVVPYIASWFEDVSSLPVSMINYLLVVSRQGMKPYPLPSIVTQALRKQLSSVGILPTLWISLFEVSFHSDRETDAHFFVIGKTRLAKWYATIPPQKRAKIVKEVTQLVLSRKAKMCNVIEYKGGSPVPCVRKG